MAVMIGGGLGVLLAAVETRLLNASAPVWVIEDALTSNSAIAGHRYRTRMGHQRDLQALIQWYMGHGQTSRRVSNFFTIGNEQMKFWTSLDPRNVGAKGLGKLDNRDNEEWFGPQLGKVTKGGHGQGSSVLKWLRTLADALGVTFLKGRVTDIDLHGAVVERVLVRDSTGEEFWVHASRVVLGTGSTGGSMFLSTIVRNDNTLLPLLFKEGVNIADTDVFMLHIAGRCSDNGLPKPGCYETDLLAECDAYVYDEKTRSLQLDPVITLYLREHRAHENMPDICRRLMSVTGMIQYKSRTASILARVSHHYSHLRIQTEDGVRVSGFDNLFAVGDMAGVGYWLGRQPRLPGTALTGCMVSAHLVAIQVSESTDSVVIKSETVRPRPELSDKQRQIMKILNTEGLFGFTANDRERTERWVKALRDRLPEDDAWVMLSREIASSCLESMTIPPE